MDRLSSDYIPVYTVIGFFNLENFNFENFNRKNKIRNSAKSHGLGAFDATNLSCVSCTAEKGFPDAPCWPTKAAGFKALLHSAVGSDGRFPALFNSAL
jgi:hypothetical protein